MRVLAAALWVVSSATACTNILVSKGASADGSTQIAYSLPCFFILRDTAI